MPKDAIPFLMFEGRAEEALNLYASVFSGAAIENLQRWPEGGPGKPGTIYQAVFSLAGQKFRFFDSPSPHAFTFTPSFSIFVTCESEAELDAAFAKLSEGGGVMMPPNNYGFSQKFAWLADRFGVSWQLNLE